MKSSNRWLGHAFIALLSSTLIGCGSSSSGGSAPSVSGTAATGAPIVARDVTAKCADGNSYPSDTDTAPDGSYTISGIPTTAFPCALEITDSGGQKLHSYATGNGTVNVTPLTDLSLALATSDKPADWFDNFDGTEVTDLSTKSLALLAALDTKGFTLPNSSADPFSTAFNADHTGWDRMLDQLQQSLSNGGKNLQNLIDDMATGGDASAALASFTAPVPFTISGTVSGAAGKVHWELWVNNNLYSSGDATNGAVTFSPTDGVFDGSVFQLGITQPANQSCTLANQSGTLTSDITDVTITCVDTTPPSSVTVHSGLAGTYSLTYQQLAAGAPFTDSQSVSASISGNTLTVGGLVMDSPASVDSAPTAIAWTDSASGITYRVFNNTTGVFSEINLFNGSTLLGQLSEASGSETPSPSTLIGALHGSYTPTVTHDNPDPVFGVAYGTAVTVDISESGVVTLHLPTEPAQDLTFDSADTSNYTFAEVSSFAGHTYEFTPTTANANKKKLIIYLDADTTPVYWEVVKSNNGGSSYSGDKMELTSPTPSEVTTLLNDIKASSYTLTVIADSTSSDGTGKLPRTLCSTYGFEIRGSSPNFQPKWSGESGSGTFAYNRRNSVYQAGDDFRQISLDSSYAPNPVRLTLKANGVLEIEALNRQPLDVNSSDPLTAVHHATTDAAAIASICTP